MKNRFLQWPILLTFMAVGLLPAANLNAQEAAGQAKPVAVLSVAPVNKILGDVRYLAEAAGQPDFGPTVAFLSAPYTQGLDKTRPIGIVVMTDGKDFSPIGFLPVSDMDLAMKIVTEQLGEPQDVGDGIKLLQTPLPVFVKPVGEWAMVAMDRDQLMNPPQDPASLVGTLPQDYDIAVRAFPGNVPELRRDVFVDEIKTGIDLSLQQEPGETPEEFQARKAMIESQLSEVDRLFEEMEEMTIGWNVDATMQGVYIDVTYKAVAGSRLADDLDRNKTVSTEFAGFSNKDAAFSLQLTQLISEQDINNAVKQMNQLRDQAVKQVEEDGDVDGEDLESAIKILDLLFDTVIETIKAGKMDGGVMVDLADGKATFLAGMFVADGQRMEDGMKELFKLLQQDEDIPPVQWDAETYKTIRIHKWPLPMEDAPPQAEQILGSEPAILMGVGEMSFYIAGGHDALAGLKSAIDTSATDAGQPAPLMDMRMSLLPILKMAQQYGDPSSELDAAVEAVAGGSDKIKISGSIDGLTANVRMLMEEGIIRAIGMAAAERNNNGLDAEDTDEVPQF